MDSGNSWELLTDGTNGIPADYPTRVVREDPDREGVLYAGTEFGMFISLDDGKSWESFQQNLPVTPITDIKIFRKDLAISTMGRGFWVLDNLSSLHQDEFHAIGNAPILFKPKDTYRYQFPKMRSANFPQPALDIDYYLPADTDKALKLEILNEEGAVIKTIVVGKDFTDDTIEDMQLSETIYIKSDKLSQDAGAQRFKWDMTHTGPWSKNENRSFRGGPRVSPGTYSARLTVGEVVLNQTFKLTADPRVLESGITQEDILAQEKLSLGVSSLLTEARKLSEALGEESKEDIQEERKLLVESAQGLLDTEKGTYMKPMLIDQISYLYGTVSRSADFYPGKDAFDRYDELMGQFEEIKNTLK